MGQVTAALVKQLRDKTGAGMMDCKKALAENEADIESATDWLRKKGLAAAAKKAGRLASEGLIGVQVQASRGAMVEVNSEADFVARNEDFQKLVRSVTELAPEVNGDADRLQAIQVPATGRTVADEITQAIATIGENISFRRTGAIEVDEGVIGSYVHSQLSPGLGKIGVLVGLKSAGDQAELEALGKQLAMHIAATKPDAVSIERLDPATVARERAIYADQARASGKPENIIEKMVDGRMRKFYEEQVLLEQVFVVDTDLRVKQAIERVAEKIGSPIIVADFLRFALGEGLETKTENLADEVAALSGA
ncbi:MAG: translation elongation factor Ts [Geminicoccaceae bacterium]